MSRREHTTSAGCRVVVEVIGTSLGVTIRQPDGTSALFAVGASDARHVAAMLAPAQPASVEAGELVDAVLEAFGVSDIHPSRFDECHGAAARLVQRALDAAEERGAEGEREQRDIERRHGPEARR